MERMFTGHSLDNIAQRDEDDWRISHSRTSLEVGHDDSTGESKPRMISSVPACNLLRMSCYRNIPISACCVTRVKSIIDELSYAANYSVVFHRLQISIIVACQ